MVFRFARKALTVAVAALAVTAGMAGPASAAGLIYNDGTRGCLKVDPNQTWRGAAVYLGDCNTYEAQWGWGSLGLVQNNRTGFCLEFPRGGGYGYLETCGRAGGVQRLAFAPSTKLIGISDDQPRMLGAVNGRVISTTYQQGPNISWSW